MGYKIKELKQNSSNPRHIAKDKLDKLKKSIKDFEQMLSLRPITIDEDGVVLGGNMRLQALKKLGYKEIPDEWVQVAQGLTEAQKKEFIIKDNVGFGEWDWDILQADWNMQELEEWGMDIPEFDEVELEAKEDDYVEPEQMEVDVVEGDLIEFICEDGRVHRLLCGDSTDSDAVARLMNGEKADMVFTDPPYGVSYEGGRSIIIIIIILKT